MLKRHSVSFRTFLILAVLLRCVISAGGQNNAVTAADEEIVFKLQATDRTEKACSDEFVTLAIAATERRANPTLLYPLANLVSTKRVSATSAKLIEGFLQQQLSSSDPSMRTSAIHTASFVAQERAVPWLLLAMADADQDVRIAALSELRLYAQSSDIQAIEEQVQKRRTMLGVTDDKDTTLAFGAETLAILRKIEGGFDDPSRFDDATFYGVVLPRAIRKGDRYSDAFVQRVIDKLRKAQGYHAQYLFSSLAHMATGKKVSATAHERITKVLAEQKDRVAETAGQP